MQPNPSPLGRPRSAPSFPLHRLACYVIAASVMLFGVLALSVDAPVEHHAQHSTAEVHA